MTAFAGSQGVLAGQRGHQLGLAVASDAADTEDLAAGDGEADVFEIRTEPLVGAQAQITATTSRGAPAWPDDLCRFGVASSPPIISFGQVPGGLAAWIAFGNDTAEPHGSSPTRRAPRSLRACG